MIKKRVSALNQFEIGEYVTCIPGFVSDNPASPLYAGGAYVPGWTFKISGFRYPDFVVQDILENHFNGKGVWEEFCRKATPEEIEKAKVRHVSLAFGI